jgi:hypothetical protein
VAKAIFFYAFRKSISQIFMKALYKSKKEDIIKIGNRFPQLGEIKR